MGGYDLVCTARFNPWRVNLSSAEESERALRKKGNARDKGSRGRRKPEQARSNWAPGDNRQVRSNGFGSLGTRTRPELEKGATDALVRL